MARLGREAAATSLMSAFHLKPKARSLMQTLSQPISEFSANMPLGRHVIAEFFGASNLDNITEMETAMIAAADIAGAIVLEARFHTFGEGQGVTGVVILAESHISIHTWPEYGYAAIDAFMCGSADPKRAVQYLKNFFSPKSVDITILKRGTPRRSNVIED